MRKLFYTTILFTILGTNLSFGQNQVLRFDGVNDLLNLGGEAGNELRSIELWFKLAYPVYSTNIERLALVARNADDQVGEFGIYIGKDFLGEQGRITFMRQIGSTFYYIYSDQNEWEGDKWYHVAAVIDPISGTKLYIDGILQEHSNTTTQPTDIQTEMTTVACWGDALIRWFSGEIDEVRFWAHALTETEIIQNMCDTIDPQAAVGLKGYWRMDEGIGHSVQDLSEMNQHGDVFGAVFMQDTLCVPVKITEEPMTIQESIIYPNPFTSEAYISFKNTLSSDTELFMYDSFGRDIGIKHVIEENKIHIYRNNLLSGMYIYEVKTTQGIISRGQLIFK